jgi:hypothetical protein
MENPLIEEIENKTPVNRTNTIMAGSARKLRIYQRIFRPIAGFIPKSDQSRVMARINSDTSNGAVPQRINPGPGEDGLPPKSGASQATKFTEIEKSMMSPIVSLRSKAFIYRVLSCCMFNSLGSSVFGEISVFFPLQTVGPLFVNWIL